ncbi:MAG TPA: DUF6438 domain-containing protein [Allosphingosinicella sp.]|jgi:hypothetical protein
MKTISIAALGLLASGCTTAPGGSGAGRPIPIESDSISYETGPCFGACPVFKVTVSADGSGTFEGRRFTTVTGERSFRITPAQYRAFAAELAPLRPAQGSVRMSGDACRQMATDLPSAEVTWFSQIGNSQSYYFYYGCDMERNRAIAERIRRAPALLPIQAMIGREL